MERLSYHFFLRETMSQDTLTFVESELTEEIVKQMRAIDTYGTNDALSAEQVVAPFIVTREQKKAIPVVGDPDEQTMSRVKVYYNALSSLIEKTCGLMAIPLLSLTHEGFGRALITVGKLVVVDKTLRDVHRFGFSSIEKLEEEAGKIVAEAVALVKKYEEVAQA
jgi:probable nitrogen fixation protein